MVAASQVPYIGKFCGGGFMKQIQYTSTLFYYDGAQVFEARDDIGGHYIAVLAPVDYALDQYLVAGVNPESLRQFRSGSLDLRTLLLRSDEEDRYLAQVENNLGRPLILERLTGPLADTELLPDAGFVLHDRPVDDYVVIEARERNNLILELSVEPPEAAAQHRIRANTLAEMLLRVQTMIKHAYRVAIRGDATRNRPPEDALLDVVVPASAGSFRVVLEAANFPDLFGASSLARALERVDTLFQSPADPQATLANTKESRGHLAGSYLKLLRFLEERQTGLQYTWAEPQSEQPIQRSISHVEAGSLVRVLSTVTDLGSEAVRLEGTFEYFNRGSGAWGLLTSEGQRRGRVRDSGPSLDGLQVGGQYVFYCDETIEEVDITGRESRMLFLNRHESTQAKITKENA